MADSATITCPDCRKKFKGQSGLQGKKIRCPLCKHAFVVPGGKSKDPDRAAEKLAAKKKPGPPPAKEPDKPPAPPPGDDEDEEGDNPYGVAQLDITYRCPACTKPMESLDAVVCLYCGYNTLTREVGTTEKLIGHTAGEKFMWLLPGLVGVLIIILMIIGDLYFCLVLPNDVRGSWAELFDHESMRLWIVVMVSFLTWGLGFFAFKRLVLHPKPPKKEKDG